MIRKIPFPIVQLTEDNSFYIAVDCNNRLASRFLRLLPSSLSYLDRYRVPVILFTDRISEVRVLSRDTIRRVYDMTPVSGEKSSIDPVISYVMSERRGPERPKLFIFSDGHVTTHWNLGIMALVVDITWFHDIHTKEVTTPTIGTRYAIDVGEPVTTRNPISLYLMHVESDNCTMLLIGNERQTVTVVSRPLDPTGVDFQMSLDEALAVAHETFKAPATLAEWTPMENHNHGWRYQLLEGS